MRNIKTEKCTTCKHFHDCDNTGSYDECVSNQFSEYNPDLFSCKDLEYVCAMALQGKLSKDDVDSLLARSDVDRDYNDMYFHPMLPVSSIRDALEQNESAMKYLR